MPLKEVTKLQIAIEQLEDALRAYFAQRFHSALVLAGAAEQLLAGYLLKHGQTPAWPRERATITKIANALQRQESEHEPETTLKDIGDLMNHAYNNAKHAGKDGHDLSLDPESEAQQVIDRAISNYDVLFALPEYDLPVLPLAQEFMAQSLRGVSLGQVE